MRLAVLAVTRNGALLGERIVAGLKEHQVDLYCKGRFAGGGRSIEGPFGTFVGSIFRRYDGLVFITALGIAVRAIAPHIRSKAEDPAVVVMDEQGKHTISVLSGHLGGANALATLLASLLGAEPVITTATDVQGKPSVETIAQDHDLRIEDLRKAKRVNAAIVDGGRVGVFSDIEIRTALPEGTEVRPLEQLGSDGESYEAVLVITNRELPVPENAAVLRPRNLVAGIGARRGVGRERVLEALRRAFAEAGLSIRSLRALATVEPKARERGIVEAAESLGIPLQVVGLEEVRGVEGEFETSEYVRRAIGVGAVCEPASVLGGRKARLRQGKRKLEGVTVAIAEEEP